MIKTEQKQQIVEQVLKARKFYTGTDGQFARTLGVNGSVFSRLKKGEVENIVSDAKWMQLAHKYGVALNPTKRPWKVAKTHVYSELEQMIFHCKIHSQSKLMVDDCGIGKTECLKAISKNNYNVFYVDCSQQATNHGFASMIANIIGSDARGTRAEIMQNVVFHLNHNLDMPVVILDEFGDVGPSKLLMVKELWNATEGQVGWFMTGADGLAQNIERGIKRRRVGYAEIFSRFAGHIIRIQPPQGSKDYKNFWRDLFTEVAKVNLKDPSRLKDVVGKCMAMSKDYRKDIRTLKDLILVNNL